MSIGVFFTIGGATVARSRSLQRQRRARLRVRYSYEAGGRRHESRLFAFGEPWFISERNTARRLRAAPPLLAHHHPQLPAIAVLETGVTAGAAARLIGGLAALAAAIAVLVKPEIASRMLRATRALRRSRASAA